MKVVISILNWNSIQETEACVESLSKILLNDCIICVTDNASKYFSKKNLKAIWPDIVIFNNSVNLGFAAGHSKALAYAKDLKADTFWILNNDTTVKSDTLEELINAYKSHGDGVFGSSSLDHKGRVKQEVVWKLKPGCNDQCSFIPFTIDELQNRDVLRVANIVGYSMFIPLKVIQKHGFMDTSFFLYYEETDYCLRLMKKGIPSFWVSSSKIYHSGKGSSSKHSALKPIMEYYLYRNFFRLLKTHAAKHILLHYSKCFLMRFLSANIFRKKSTPLLLNIHLTAIYHAFIGKSGTSFYPDNFLDK